MTEIHRHWPSLTLQVVAGLLSAVGCDSQWEPPTTGVLEVSTQTSGASLDADGYTVVVDDVPGEAAVGIAGTTSRTLSPRAGGYTVELSGIAPNCAVAGPNPRPIAVEAGRTTSATFEVVCTYVPREISFTSRRGEATDVYAVGLDEGEFTVRMTVSGAAAPAWSPDGSRLAFARDGDVWISDADGTNRRPVAISSDDLVLELVWSPDASRIMYSTIRWIDACPESVISGTSSADGTTTWIANTEGGGQVRLSSGIGTAWSPDGTKVAVTRPDNPIDDCPPTDIHLIDVDGSEEPVVLAGESAREEDAVWSPDGTRIAFTSTRSTRGGNSDIYVMDADGSNIARLTTDPGSHRHPAWSPDGERIAFTTTRDGDAEIYVMRADGSNPINLTNHPAWDGDPSWGPMVDSPPR